MRFAGVWRGAVGRVQDLWLWTGQHPFGRLEDSQGVAVQLGSWVDTNKTVGKLG